MVTLQILVLSFLVRVRVSQLVSIFLKWKMLFLFIILACETWINNKTQGKRPGFCCFICSRHQ